MPIHEEYSLESVPHQRHNDIAHNDNHGRWLQRDCTGKCHMMLRHPIRQSGRHIGLRRLANLSADDFRRQGIGPD